MVKPIKKIQFWCSDEQYDYIKKSPYLLVKEIQLYKISNDITFCRSIKADKKHLDNTLSYYKHNRANEQEPLKFLNKVKKTLQSIIKYDVVFRLNKENYLFHTYKILGFIQSHIEAYKLSQDKEFFKGTIGDYGDREKKYYLDEYLDNREQMCKPNNLNKGANLLNAYMYRSLYLHKDFTKYYLSYITLFGVENIRLLQGTIMEIKIIKKAIQVFQSGRVTVEDCSKSLLAVLYYYFRFIMKIPTSEALLNAQYIVDDVFNCAHKYKGSDLIKNVYVKDVIGSNIIYSFDTKKIHITNKQKDFLSNTVLDDSFIDTKKLPQQILKPSLENPLILYSTLTPSELLQKI